MMAIYGMLVFAFFVTVALIAGGIILYSLVERVERINRNYMHHWGTYGEIEPTAFTSDDPARQAAWEQSEREQFAMCGACGKSVKVMPDRFTLEAHDCDFNPDFMKDTLQA